MAMLAPAEVEHWLCSLGSLLPREAVLALANEVRRHDMDGATFGELVASRATPSLGDAVQPRHMATLRRCWNATYGFAPAQRGTATSASSSGVARAVSQPAACRGAAQQSSAAAWAASLWDVSSKGQAKSDTASSAAKVAEKHTASTPPRRQAKPRKPPHVPPLDLLSIHGPTGRSVRGTALAGHAWAKPVVVPAAEPAKAAPSLGRAAAGAGVKVERTGPSYASASAEDQQHVAQFYGYRDEAFRSTMQSLKTDEIRSRLFLGNMADAAYWPLLESLQITHVLNCAVEAQKVPPPYETHGLQYLLIPLHDSVEQAQLLSRQRFRPIREATKFIRQALTERGEGLPKKPAVLVHCVQGLSRSAAVLCAYLMEYEGMSRERAVAEVQSKHRGCLTSQHWQSMLHRLDAELLRGF